MAATNTPLASRSIRSRCFAEGASGDLQALSEKPVSPNAAIGQSGAATFPHLMNAELLPGREPYLANKWRLESFQIHIKTGLQLDRTR